MGVRVKRKINESWPGKLSEVICRSIRLAHDGQTKGFREAVVEFLKAFHYNAQI